MCLRLRLPKVSTGDQFDLNADSVINAADAAVWLRDKAYADGSIDAYLPGDSNLDGKVDTRDLNAVALNWSGVSTNWSGGDFNFDGKTDVGDLNTLALNWNKSIDVGLNRAAVWATRASS